MKASDIVGALMWDYEELSRDELSSLCAPLHRKTIRWLAQNHPDNRTRRLFFELTGVPIGGGTVLNVHLTLYDEFRGLISFGERAAVASGVTIIAASGVNNSRLIAIPEVRDSLVRTLPVAIDDDAWIGARAVILPGVTVGEGAIVAAGAVVREDVRPFTIVAGVPARLIRTLR